MGCGKTRSNANSVANVVVNTISANAESQFQQSTLQTANPHLPQLSVLQTANPPLPQPSALQTANPPLPKPSALQTANPPAYSTDYNPEATFRLTVKDLRGGAPLLFDDVKPKLKGRELHGKIKEKSGKLGEMLLVLYGRIVKSDEIEIGKRGLSKEATVYCVYKPDE